MPVSLRKLSKNAFKTKIKQTLFEILASEDCYINLPEIVQKVKGAVSRQYSSFCLILPITRPQSLWNLK